MEDSISRAEHNEFCRRIEDENARQNKRIDLLEKSTEQVEKLATAVEKMAVSLQSMVKEQEQQGQRLTALEARDGEMWRQVIKYAVTAVAGILIGYLFKQIGM